MNLLTTTQLAAKLGVSSICIRQWVAEERLKPALRLANGQYLFRLGTKRPKRLREYPR